MGRKIQYSAPLRRVAKGQDYSAPYVGAYFTEYQRAIEAILKTVNTIGIGDQLFFLLCFI